MLEQNGEKVPDLELVGKWDEGMSVKRGHGPAEQLWVKSPAPANPTRSAPGLSVEDWGFRVWGVMIPGRVSLAGG